MASTTELQDVVVRILTSSIKRLPGSKNFQCLPETKLVGKDSALDSLGFANFVLALEEHFEDEFSIELGLSDTDFVDLFEGDSLTVASLCEFLAVKVNRSENG